MRILLRDLGFQRVVFLAVAGLVELLLVFLDLRLRCLDRSFLVANLRREILEVLLGFGRDLPLRQCMHALTYDSAMVGPSWKH